MTRELIPYHKSQIAFSEDFFIITCFPDHEVLDTFLFQLFEMYISMSWVRWITAPEEGLPNIDEKVVKLHLRNFLGKTVTLQFYL